MDAGVATIAMAVALASCGGTPAVNLRPDNIPPGHGAVFGHVQVFKGQSEVTGACYIAFTDDENENKAQLSLDKSGWIFTPLRAGPTYLSFVNCAVWNGLMYGTRQLRFDVTRQGASTYFGHVRFDLPNKDWEITVTAMARGVASVPVTSVTGALASNAATAAATGIQFSSPDGENSVIVKNESEVAIREYIARYGRNPKVVSALAGSVP